MFKNTITIQKWIKEDDSFIENGTVSYNVEFVQTDTTSVFKIYVNGFNTNVKIDVANPTFPYRDRVATAINKYRKVEVGIQKMLSVKNFSRRDELTELNLIH